MRGSLCLLALALAASAVACVDPETSSCGELICPVDRLCDPHRVTCVQAAQVSACAGVVDGVGCQYPGEDQGVCDHGVCHPGACGDGFTTGPEVCDDGGQRDGDGCSARCDSDERCGNGVVDVAVGESCDDGGLASSDGCDSRCQVEVATWHQVTFEAGGGQYGAELAYDTARQRAVMFGGVDPTGLRTGDVWELDGAQWNHRPGPPGPAGRDGHVLVYDPLARAVVLFGGDVGPAGLQGDVWRYDGAWHPVTTNPGPSPRAGAAGAYVASSGAVVVFGGADAAGLSAETWELRGATWQRRVVVGPAARRDHRMAYDAARDRLVLFGGTGASGALTDTWEWNGSAWARLVTATTIPSARGAMAWDADRRRVVLFGGQAAVDGTAWELDGVDWRPVAGGPPARRRPAMTYDPVHHQIVMEGGTARAPGIPGPTLQDTWRYDGAWTAGPAIVNSPPSARNDAGFTYDPVRRAMALAGGVTPPSSSHADTALYDGRQWLRDVDVPTLEVCHGPVCTSRMVFDEARGQLVLVRADGPTLQTWRFDGRRWLPLVTSGAPPGRQWFTLAYDRRRGRTVLFGGGQVQGGELDDTWELVGAAWTPVTTAQRPPARAEAALAYDDRRGALVLFGGKRANLPLDDTWTFDGTTWTQLAGPRPPARFGAGLAYHRARGRVLLFGGDQPPAVFTDLWELAGDGWHELVIFEGPGARRSPHLAYDPERDVMVLHGGDPRNDTWELRFRSVDPPEVCALPGDEDGDGQSDCGDADCADAACGPGQVCAAGACGCLFARELRCGDGADDDCDGQLDCADGDCAGGPLCSREAACGDRADDDGDGYTDCADPGCVGIGGCEAREAACGDSADNDGDGLADCADPDCFLRGCEVLR